MKESRVFLEHAAILDLVEGMSGVLKKHLSDRAIEDAAVIGIHTGGAWIARHLHDHLRPSQPLGLLDINFYRDDFSRSGLNPRIKPSSIDFTVDNRHIVLVDDVLQTGRTIRAALNEVFDYGRPATVTLVTLIERSGRELPIQPDVIGLRPPLQPGDHIKLEGPDPLRLTIMRQD